MNDEEHYIPVTVTASAGRSLVTILQTQQLNECMYLTTAKHVPNND